MAIGDNVALRPGNITELGNIPEGTAINNLEIRPGDGGKIARSAGNSCTVESRVGKMVRVRMPSGALKELPATCRATIGVLAGHGRFVTGLAPSLLDGLLEPPVPVHAVAQTVVDACLEEEYAEGFVALGVEEILKRC